MRESAPAGPNHAKHFQNLPTTCSKARKSSQMLPQTLPKPSPNLLKATQNRPKRPLGAHFGPMLEKDMVLNVQKTPKYAQNWLKVAISRPRAPQTLPKWTPKPSQIHFLGHFLRFIFPFQICIDFSLVFSSFLKKKRRKNRKK